MLEQFATNNEAVIILFGFLLEIVLSTAMLAILVLEYFYDKEIEESKSKHRKRSKRVKILIDSDGNATIAEAPKGLDISVDHQGEK